MPSWSTNANVPVSPRPSSATSALKADSADTSISKMMAPRRAPVPSIGITTGIVGRLVVLPGATGRIEGRAAASESSIPGRVTRSPTDVGPSRAPLVTVPVSSTSSTPVRASGSVTIASTRSRSAGSPGASVQDPLPSPASDE
jgi:hypothetical protein